jgi:SAM-dependent methyltransferase
MSGSDAKFTGTIPEKYDTYLGPLLFEHYAAHLAGKLALSPDCRVLEVACGTGVLTRRLLQALPPKGTLVASDLNPGMLDYARGKVGPDTRLEWKVADAMKLPFGDASFDVVAIQFGVMFFPDKVAALKETKRVLKPGGTLVFNVWDSMEHNLSAKIVHELGMRKFPADPPKFFLVPFGYYDVGRIRADLQAAGFTGVLTEEVPYEATSPTAKHAAIGLVEGCPMIVALQERGVTDSAPFVAEAEKLLAEAFGDSPMRTSLKAIWVNGRK